MAVNACLCPVVSIHGCAVITVEGIGSTKTRLHPVQERIAKSHGSQCGFCTPGIVMSVYAMLRSLEKAPDEKDIEIALQGIDRFNVYVRNVMTLGLIILRDVVFEFRKLVQVYRLQTDFRGSFDVYRTRSKRMFDGR